MGLLWFFAFSLQSLFLYSLFSFTVTNSFSSVKPAPCLEHESYALLKFKESFVISKSASYYSPSYPKTDSWIQNTDCCSWDGVECDELTGHVTELDLSSSQLYGSINSNSSLFELVHVQSLSLFDNHFNYSKIPSRFGDLSMLKHLNLSLSKFIGEIPPEISQLSKLVSLSLASNVASPDTNNTINLLQLSESNLRRLVQNLTNLEILQVAFVTIASRVPDTLTNLTSLTELSLMGCELYGEFPVRIFHLPKLKILNLKFNENLNGKLPAFNSSGLLNVLSIRDCNFNGSIPSSLGNLTQLTALNLGYNNFEGHLSSSLSNLPNLGFLGVGSNKLTSKNISWVGKLTRLNTLDLSRISIGTEIPISFTNLTQLIQLDLSYCNLSGEIPSKIMNITNLVYLNFRANNLCGEIPHSLFALKSLSSIAFDNNMLTGQLELNLFLKFKSLTFLSLSHNNLSLLTGTSSFNVTDLPQIQVLAVASCNISEFPDFLRDQNELGCLNMSQNSIHSLPSWLWSKKSLVSLSVPHNSLDGELSAMICNLKSLTLLDLSFNNLSSIIPSCFGSFSQSLEILNLRGNKLHGLIPQTCVNGSALKMIDFSQNNLQGLLPRALSKCHMLEYLDVSQNQIKDSFPFWLGNLPELKVLALRYNKIFGPIRCPKICKFSKLHIIDLSHNGFIGNLPYEIIQNWKSMRTGDMNELQYKQRRRDYMKHGLSWSEDHTYSFTMNNKGIVMVYERLQQFYSYIAIDLSNNKIGGEIPDVIGDLKGLVLLNLSNNMLSGGIPTSFSKLSQLEALDLSHNNLSGKIPSELVQLTFLEFFNVSYNNLGGPIPNEKQFETFSNSSFEGNQELCGFPLSKKCEDPSSAPSSASNEDQDTDHFFEFGWKVVLMGYGCGLVAGLVIGSTLSLEKYKWLLRRK